jgi:hypothetical protein
MTPTKPRFRIKINTRRRDGIHLGVSAVPFAWDANEWVDGPSERGIRLTLDLLFITFTCSIFRQGAYYSP